MEQSINKLLEITEQAIQWLTTSPDNTIEKRKSYDKLVGFRRELKKKKYALAGNPAAAVYGESQVGKSYLTSSLLSEQGKPFEVNDINDVVYNFIKDINPPGGGTESTGLVTRFSVKYKPHKPEYPVKAVLLSPVDIVLTLCDSYYSDIKINDVLQKEEIDAAIDMLKMKFQNCQENQEFFVDDDVMDIKDYIENNFSAKASQVISSKFFKDIPKLISKVKYYDWKDVFSLLWNNNEKITDLFSKLIDNYAKINFVDSVFLPLEAVLYKHGTLLYIKRLEEIYKKPEKIEAEYKQETSVLYYDHSEECEVRFSKSYLCALSAEVIFGLPESLKTSKPFLNETDLLDFPGARSRMAIPEDKIEEKSISQLLIRGKVAYLFNKYSDSEKINILLFCAKHEQAAQRLMPEMLNNWIGKIIGKDMESRQEFIEKSIIPPLFIIGTWFNVNLEYNSLHDKKGNISSLNYRWDQRFVNTLAKQMLEVDHYEWFENWTTSLPKFKNIFLLRDFALSETKSQIFKGYNSNKEEMNEIYPEDYPDLRKNLRQSFIDFQFVKDHFENPAESFDEAADMNKDGTQLIIKKLTIAAENINTARNEKIIGEFNFIMEKIVDELKKYYHNTDEDCLYKEAMENAGIIRLKLNSAFKNDFYFFGSMIRELLVDDDQIRILFESKKDEKSKPDVYAAFWIDVPRLNKNAAFDENLKILCEAYNLKYEEKTIDEWVLFFNKHGVDLKVLFSGVSRQKSFSEILASSLDKLWYKQQLNEDKCKIFYNILSDKAQAMVDMMVTLYDNLQISNKIEEKIRFINDNKDNNEAYEMIANICAEIVNRFTNSIGFHYYGEVVFESNAKSLDVLFEEIDDLKGKTRAEQCSIIESMSVISNYRTWYKLIEIGFSSTHDTITYDVEKNGELGKLITRTEEFKTFCYGRS